MKVYRLEYKGTGPFQCGPLLSMSAEEVRQWREWRNNLSLDTVHVTPPQDGLYPVDIEQLFGCQSYEILCWWFDPIIEIAIKYGYQISVYEVEEGEYKIGKNKTQVKFSKNAAKLVEVFNPGTWRK